VTDWGDVLVHPNLWAAVAVVVVVVVVVVLAGRR
jgi:hypothetical protein